MYKQSFSGEVKDSVIVSLFVVFFMSKAYIPPLSCLSPIRTNSTWKYTLKHSHIHTNTHTQIHTPTHTNTHTHTQCERVVFAGTECSSPSIGNEWVGE